METAFHGSFRRSLGFALMALVVFEASLFGSGQLLHVGAVTVKMILFGMCVVFIVVSSIAGERIPATTVALLALAGATAAFAAVLGMAHSAPLKYLGEDISPLLYVLMLPFFEFTLRNYKDLKIAENIIVTSAILIVIGYVAVLGALLSGYLSVMAVYTLLMDSSDFMYDGLSWRIFYKGSLYLAMAIFIFGFRKGGWAKAGMLFCFAGLLLTVTRGFLLALAVTCVLYALIRPARPLVRLVTVAAVLLLVCILVPSLFLAVGDKTESDMDRIVTLKEVGERASPGSLVFGHGFGIGVPRRPEHMEIAYLEIAQKQGMIGFLFTGALILVFAYRFRRAVEAGNRTQATPLLLSAAFVFVESLTNPFVTNPIGLSMLFISLAGLRALTVTSVQPELTAMPRVLHG